MGSSWKRFAGRHQKVFVIIAIGGVDAIATVTVRKTFTWSWRRIDFLLAEKVFQLHDVFDFLLDWSQKVSQDVDQVMASYCDIPVKQKQ